MAESYKQTSRDSEVDLGELFRVLWQRKLFIVVFVILSSFLAFSLIKKLPNIYRSTVLIMLKTPSKSTDAIQSLMNGALTAADSTETELQLIKSKNILSQVVDDLDLTNHIYFNSTNNSVKQMDKNVEPHERVLKILTRNIIVKQLPGTDLISISFESQNPELSALVANKIGVAFIAYKETLMAGEHKQGAKFLASKLEEVKKSLELAELKIVEYQNTHEFIDIRSAVSLATSKLSQLYNKRDALLASIEKLSISKSHIESNKANLESLMFLPMFTSTNGLTSHQANIKKLDQKFAEVRLRYGPKHPKYMAAEQLLNESNAQLDNLISEQVDKIKSQIEVEQQQVDFFNQELHKLKQRLNQLGIIEFDYEKLKKEFEANLALYENLVKKQTESELMQDLTNASNSILIESADVERTPVRPNRTMLLILSIIGCLLFGCFVVLLEYFMGNKVIKFRKIAARYDTKVIGSIPKLSKSGKGVITNINEKKNNAFIEGIRGVRTSILLNKNRSEHEVIAITSISPNDGKSTLSFQLSKCFSEVGSALLVDADLRYPSIAKALKEELERPGLTNLVVGSHSFSDSVVKDQGNNFDVITSGHIPKNPLAFLQHAKFKKLLDELKTKYQRVILECPPIMSVSDAFVISKYVDSVYLVVDASKAHAMDLASVLEELEQADVKVGGVILNKVKKKRGYSHQYYGYHSHPSRSA